MLLLLSAPVRIHIDKKSKLKIKKSYDHLVNILSKGETIYGVNTGFGKLSQVKIKRRIKNKLQINLIKSHSAGVGETMDSGIVRLAMVLKLINYCHGYSGVHSSTVDQLVTFINHDLIPMVPEKGSVGASGDLAQLAHIASALIGEGKLIVNNKIDPQRQYLKALEIKPLKLHQKMESVW